MSRWVEKFCPKCKTEYTAIVPDYCAVYIYIGVCPNCEKRELESKRLREKVKRTNKQIKRKLINCLQK
jgi:hypothetical protein